MFSKRAFASPALAATFAAFALTLLVAAGALAAGVAAVPASAAWSAPELQPQALVRAKTFVAVRRVDMAAATAEPDAFELVLDGVRTSSGPRDLFSLGFRTEGTFTALDHAVPGGELNAKFS